MNKGLILALIESIIDNMENLRLGRVLENYSDVCLISEMLDKLEDFLMDDKNYSSNFKEDVRYIRYLVWSIPAVSVGSRIYFIRKAIWNTEILKEKLNS